MARVSVAKNIAYDNDKRLYYVNLDYGKNTEGKRIKKCVTYKTKAEAVKALKDFEAKKHMGQVVQPNTTTLREWLDYWLTSVRMSQAS